MIDATVLFLTFTDQQKWGFSGKMGIELNCSTDVDDNWYGCLCRAFERALRYDLYRRANMGGVCAANREIIEIAKIYHPDYVIYPCNFSGIVTEATLATLRRIGCVVVGYFFDDDIYFENRSKWMIPYLDYCVTHVRARSADYERLGARCILAACIPMNPSIFRRFDDQEELYDATFVGGLHANRRKYSADIASHGIDVRNFGGSGFSEKLHYARMVEIFNQSRINLHFSLNTDSDPPVKQIKGRIFEVTLCGGFLLTEYAPDLEQYFEIGREIVCFETAAEATEKSRYYLQHSDERKEIAARGYARAQCDYTGQEQLLKVFLAIEDDLRMRGRPQQTASINGLNSLRETDAKKYYRWAKALLKEPFPLRDAWRETSELVLATNPEHGGAKRLLWKDKKWGDPEPFSCKAKLVKWFLVKVLRCAYMLVRPKLSFLKRWTKRIMRK